jgi:hypothetical protein
MQVCWFIMECFEQCSQWNAKWGLGLEPWGFCILPTLRTWIFECLFGFIFCTRVALCIVPQYNYVTHCWSWNFVWYVRGLRTWNFGWVMGARTLLLHMGRISFEIGVQILGNVWPCSVHVVICLCSLLLGSLLNVKF